MGAGVPSCETCTPSYARSEDPDEEEDEDGRDDLAHTGVLRYSPDEDDAVERWVVSVSWDAGPAVRLGATVARSWALRSTPSTILEPDGWLA